MVFYILQLLSMCIIYAIFRMDRMHDFLQSVDQLINILLAKHDRRLNF